MNIDTHFDSRYGRYARGGGARCLHAAARGRPLAGL